MREAKLSSGRAPISRLPPAWRVVSCIGLALVINFSHDHVYTQDALSNLDRDNLLRARGSLGIPDLQERRAAQLKAPVLPRTPAGEGALPLEAEPPAATEERAKAELVKKEAPEDKVEEAPLSAFERQLAKHGDPLVDRPVRQFGYDVFSRERVNVDLPVGSDYVLGSGDRLVVSLFGSADIDRDLPVEIDRSGQARLPLVGPVALKGLSIGRAEELLKRRYDRFYQNYELTVQLATIRDVSVHVTGRVERPGRVRLPAVATLFDALAAAGGVSKDGSLRQVTLRRKGTEPRALDLYGYLLDGDRDADLQIESDDVIHVPPVGPRVAVVGRVLRPAIYEQKGASTPISEVLAMAGGFERLANRHQFQIESVTDNGIEARTTSAADAAAAAAIELRDGDVVVIQSAAPRLENTVYLKGNVALPGRYAYKENMRVSDLVTAEVLVEAGFWLDRGSPMSDDERKRAIRDHGSKDDEERDQDDRDHDDERDDKRDGDRRADEKLAARDEKKSPNPTELEKKLEEERRREERQKRLQRLEGREMPEPFLEYALIRRINPVNLQETRLAFHLGKAIVDRDPRENHVLQPQDTVVIFPRKEFEVARTVHIDGAVQNPSAFELRPGMRVLDLVRMSGGILPEAHLASATLTRIHAEQSGTEFQHLVIDLNEVLSGVESANVLLKENDSLTVRVVPDYKKPYRVTISGEVRHPGPYTVVPGERLSRFLQRAGGYTPDAYLPAAQFYRQTVKQMQKTRINDALDRLELEAKITAQAYAAEAAVIEEDKEAVAAEQSRIDRLIASLRRVEPTGRMVVRLREIESIENSPDDVELQDGDHIVVPRRPDEVHVVGAVFNQTAHLYKKDLHARDYLNRCGGPTRTADIDVAFIIRADGSAESASSHREDYHWDSEEWRYTKGDLLAAPLQPGDTLVVPYDVKPQLSKLGLTKTITQIMFQVATTVGVIVALSI